jgi:hypothetical protein
MLVDDAGRLLVHVESLMAEVKELRRRFEEEALRHCDVTDHRAKAATRQARYRASRRAQDSLNGRSNVTGDATVTSRVTSPLRDTGGLQGGSLALVVDQEEREKHPLSSPVTQSDVTAGSEIAAVRQIFATWQEVWSKPKHALIPSRERKIRTRLRDGYAAERLCDAIRGSKLDPWDGRAAQCDIEQLLKPANIDKFADLWAERKRNVTPQATRTPGDEFLEYEAGLRKQLGIP